MDDITSFFRGYKNALLYNPNYEHTIYTQDELNQLSSFPFTMIPLYRMNQHLYFRSEELKQEFLTKTTHLVPDSHFYHREVGLVLGIPPKAVDFYISILTLEDQKISVGYCGIHFATHIHSLFDDVDYLWTTVQVSDTDRTDTQISYKQIDAVIHFHDYAALHRVHAQIKKALIAQGYITSE